jgi:hypothetical protein
MTPVLRRVVNVGAGTVTGQVTDGKTVCLYKKGATRDGDDSGANAETCAVVRAGDFRLAFVPAGVYGLRIFGVSGKLADSADVTVNAGQTVDLGELSQ